MGKIRILVVDDAVVVRRLLTDMLSSDPALEVVGAAANGHIALARIPLLNPDLVVLDVEMPEMDGLETLAEIRKSYKRLPVIMFSTLTRRGAAATLDALSLGASDYVTKPSNLGAGGQAIEQTARELRREDQALLSGLCPASPRHSSGNDGRGRAPGNHDFACRSQAAEVVAMGVSTGGPNVLAELMPFFPANLAVPMLIVQHMPPIFTKLLAERLASKSRIPMQEARPGQTLEPGTAWLAPGDFHMVIERSGVEIRIRTNKEPPENSCRPAVDTLFRSVAAVYGPATLAVVMTGMGQDGLRGCETIRSVGGQIIVQDEATSVVWGMPGFVARAGLADRIVPLCQLGPEILRRIRKQPPSRTASEFAARQI